MSQHLPMPGPVAASDLPIAAGSSVSIPLHILSRGAQPAAGYKIGIELMLANAGSETRTPPRMFEFDTGGQGFWAHPTDGTPEPAATAAPLSITYTSGNVFTAAPTPVTITFARAEPTGLSATATVGVITGADTSFPFQTYFYGDFGASLQVYSDGTGPGLLTVLSQLPAPYNSGFIVALGAYPPADGATGQLIVGLTGALRDKFPNRLKMTSAAPYVAGVSAAPIPTFDEVLLAGTLQVGAQTAGSIGILFDTGAPSTELHSGSCLPGSVTVGSGAFLQLAPTGADGYALLAFPVGDEASYTRAAMGQKTPATHYPAGYVNTGLDAFFHYPVMFDLEQGLIGFPAVAEQRG